MYIKILFFRPELDGYARKRYTYFTNLPLRCGDKVIAPTAKGDNRAIVAETGILEDEIDSAIFSSMREITVLDGEEASEV